MTSIEHTYQKKTQLEHILLRPDTYVGSVQQQTQQLWVLSKDGQSFENRNITYVPALYKIFDEILVNASDNYQRDKRMKKLDVTIDNEKNIISIYNDGASIPVQIHKQYNVYVSEMIFGQLLTSSNYNDHEKKVTGGRNGYGAKLTNIFSKKFSIETADSKNKLKLTMTWSKNMQEREEPKITKYTEADYTRISFEPDLKRFHMQKLDDDILDLMKKRVYDMAGIIGGSVRVFLNGKKIEINNFSEYCDFYLKNSDYNESREIIKVADNKNTNNERWEIIASVSEGQFQQVSFVNSICTTKGGTHVNYITDQLCERLLEKLKSKQKGSSNIKQFQIKNHIWIFINALIENPSFDSQTKETLTLKQQDFGSQCIVSEKFLKDYLKTGILENILVQIKAKEQAKMKKALSSNKQSRLLGIPKLEDANDAGTRLGDQCTLFVTEGDSAKALAMSGIEVVGRDKFGVFPLKGKMLNVREASVKQITENQEIQNIIKIMGLKLGAKYENTKSLRYGSIAIMADQDHDGSHIKGLFINFIQNFWPSLFEMKGFLKEFVTPIVKVRKGEQSLSFFSLHDFKKWKNSLGDNSNQWKTKYYKGLGTSTDMEAREYFQNVEKHMISFTYLNDEDEESIDLAFNKKKADARKEWLNAFNEDDNVDHTQKNLRYKDFVHKELINFSISDNARSIPNICDGLKTGQRKILFACFKRNLKQEIKVAQLSGYVAEHSAYHHGEQSLAQTITGMAQNFVGSNNINLLMPIGQFGSRNMGGKEAASARYIHTNLNKITRVIFPQNDDYILQYLEDDGYLVEPKYYLPIIPMVLVNGAEGIGTGWSTSIPQYNPREIVQSIQKRMEGENWEQLIPWYKGYQGEIENNDKGQYNVKGRASIIGENLVEITELPIKKWTRDFKNFLEEKMESSKDKEQEIEDIKEYHTGNNVRFEVKMVNGMLDKILKEGGLDKYFKLVSSISTSNMVLFNHEGKIVKYNNIQEIMEDFYKLRLDLYKQRKEFLASKILRDLEILNNKKRFILSVIEEKLDIKNTKKKEILKQLVALRFVEMRNMPKIKQSNKFLNEKLNQDEENSEFQEEETTFKEFNYLLQMPIWNLSYEKIEEIKNQCEQKEKELAEILKKDVKDIWKDDLNEFVNVLNEIEENEDIEKQERFKKITSKNGKKKNKKDGDDLDFEFKNKQKQNQQKQQQTQRKNIKKNYNEDEMEEEDEDEFVIQKQEKQKPKEIKTKQNNQQEQEQKLELQKQQQEQKSQQQEILKKQDNLQSTLDKYLVNFNSTKTPENQVFDLKSINLKENYELPLEERIKIRQFQQKLESSKKENMNQDEDKQEVKSVKKKTTKVIESDKKKEIKNNKMFNCKRKIISDSDDLFDEVKNLLKDEIFETKQKTVKKDQIEKNDIKDKTIKKIKINNENDNGDKLNIIKNNKKRGQNKDKQIIETPIKDEDNKKEKLKNQQTTRTQRNRKKIVYQEDDEDDDDEEFY
ncbi:topoisomerase ii beta 180kda, putative [Ichthyophthirius multifiliis]|uniref:DNA topoisomerase 2 n=1 Tax=Ichthyophthirius multifiliis TaxID=5932 RepID=G0QS48_ICHMU|nr:topoisomerase ii beta 180kda, putative [Ichthyophthirius multifiliis]EGR31961.1 topoisomerase ii beta 180kda, putative [Ichthyophthirius multifiliis]|eukprot:XP_004035447.1 topoisomerase ii beta 180kda, putative [Ichthyophthirius multifiliis]